MTDHHAGVQNAFDSPTFGKDGSFFVDKPVGSMSISPCGRDVVLASRQGLHIIDLDSPWTPPRHLSHLTPWEVADVQWSPFASRDYWVVSTSNQKALVWNLAMSTPSASIEHVLHAHTRAITDINFSAHHPDLLATCAVDSFIHCWDLRFPARPAITFCDWFAGATQVKWNRQEGHIVASAHDKVLRIWDDRKGAHPLRSIVAHSTKIYGIDWNRTESHKLVTCSLDKTVKFWDYENETDEPERSLKTEFPVWRARHTPFGQGLLAMPQHNDFNLHLYDRRPESVKLKDDNMPCVKKFTGHESHVKEFLWRARGSVNSDNDKREWQLVTWSSDLTLRLHRMTDADLELVGYRRGDPVDAKLFLTRRDAPYKTFREDPGKSFSPQIRTNAPVGEPSNDLESSFDYHQPSAKPIIPSPSAALGGWMSSGFVNSRPNPMNRTTAQKDLDPITWMKGVKIGKREAAGDGGLPAVVSPNFKEYKATDEFESLGDEITHVGTKFGRVEFSRVEVQRRYVQISIQGPWGAKHSMTYLNCRIDFPSEYPQLAHPLVKIERTATLPDETTAKLHDDAKSLGLAFQAYGKASFEALIRYLQGEQTLDDLTAWTKDDPDASIYDYGAASDGSSSDDEDDLGAFVGQQDGEIGMTGSGVLSVSNANVNVPLARSCGAAWAPNGRLVCFFSHKEEVSHSLAGSLGLDDFASLSRSKRRVYEGLGRVHPTSATLKSKTSSLATMESDDSDSDYSSDSSDLSSSSSWPSQGEIGQKGQYMGLHAPMRPSISPFQGPDHLAEEARRSNASLSGTKSRTGTGKCFVSIHDYTSRLPSRAALAKNYDLTASGAGFINASIAREQGLMDLADAWIIIDMILKDTIPLRESLLYSELHSIVPDHTETMTGTHGVSDAEVDSKGPAKWGNHPFGKSFLVEQLFSHFAKLGDIQMLAAMSCMFHDPGVQSESRGSRQYTVNTPGSIVRNVLVPILPSPSTISNQIDYFTPVETMGRYPPEQSLHIESIDKKRFEPSSLSSSFGAPGSEGRTSYPSAITPSSISKLSRRSSDQPGTEPVPISSSPERLRWAQRSGSQIANALSSSFHRPFFTASASSSPPSTFSKKKISPIGSFGTTSFSQQGPLRTVSRSMSTNEEPKFIEKSSQVNRTKKGDFIRARVPKFRVRLKNQEQDDSDAAAKDTLLNTRERWRYAIWRSHYADLLAAWELFLPRAEVLKFNSVSRDPVQEPYRESAFEIGKRMTPNACISAGADVVLVHAFTLRKPQSSPTWTAEGPGTHQLQGTTVVICLLCAEYVHGRSQPCLNCGHVMHAACWDAAVGAQGHEAFSCLSGCGCRCSEHVQVSGHRIESRTQNETQRPPAMHDAHVSPKQAIEDEAAVPWEDVAYESLVKNLGALRRNSKMWKTKGRSSAKGA